MARYRVKDVAIRGSFKGIGAYERALKRAREMARIAKRSFVVLEIDPVGYETPVAEVKYRENRRS